jgi:hypothetical protein
VHGDTFRAGTDSSARAQTFKALEQLVQELTSLTEVCESGADPRALAAATRGAHRPRRRSRAPGAVQRHGSARVRVERVALCFCGVAVPAASAAAAALRGASIRLVTHAPAAHTADGTWASAQRFDSTATLRGRAGVARLRLLLHFVDALEKHISNAAESFFSFSPASRGAFLFFRAHRKVPRAQCRKYPWGTVRRPTWLRSSRSGHSAD